MPNNAVARLHRLLSAFVGLLVLIVGAWVGTRLLIDDYRHEHDRQAAILFEELALITGEFNSILNRLNVGGFDQCSDAAMLEMRRELFLAEYAKDIGFFEDDFLVCTTGLGLLDTPVPRGEFDYLGPTGLEVQVSTDLVLFDEQYAALIVKKGHYNLVYDLTSLKRLTGSFNDWEILYQGMVTPISVAGSNAIFRSILPEKHQQFGLLNQYSEYCDTKSQYCIAIESDFSILYEKYRSLAIVVGLLVLLIGLYSALLTFRLIERSQSLRARVARALRHQNFYSLYQPIVKLDTGAVVGCEVLARCHLLNVDLFPDEFIPEIRRQDRSWEFTIQLLKDSLHELDEQTSLPDDFRVNFNLFPNDIVTGKTNHLKTIERLNGSRFQVVFEITEDQELEGPKAQSALVQLKNDGYGIALDDFGTGYSNLNQVRDFRCDYLKIDRSFIMDLEDGSIKSSLIPHIVDIARQLDLHVVAEGIENAQQWQVLQSMGVRYGQGYFFGKPMTASDLSKLVQQGPIRH